MNRLQYERSPYLLQHASNPVDWYPWGEEAFAKARQEDKPVFLSIGYATCHWCHVMAHESFEDDGIAALMNAAFVNIKVDREERPDIDSVYMHVCQGLSGGGGWPLTIVMTPDKEAFFAGTYFPRESYAGRIGMRDLVERIDVLWKNERAQIIGSAKQIQDWLRREVPQGGGEEPGEGTLKAAFEELKARYDSVYGGFGVPKFPTPHHLTFLLRYYRRFRDEQALAMVEKTLTAMRDGGIYDHVGGGFHRYATDERWFLPHFEKMLYDQAQLVMAYTEAYQVTGKVEYAETAREIIDYVMRDLRAPEGCFYCAEDADSEGVEGKFYVWTEPEIRAVLDEQEAEAWVRVFGVEPAGNYQDEASRRQTGANVFFRKLALAEAAWDLNLGKNELGELLERARRKLLDARAQRIRPHRDDKVLCDWNGLMIAALAKAAQMFDDPGYAEAARGAADFILAAMRTPQGALFHRWRDGEAGISGFLEDYAFFVWGLIELYEATFEVRYLEAALDMNARLIELFRDEGAGGFYQSASDELVRRKDLVDGALPSGNSVAALNLVRLGRLTGQQELEALAVRIGESFSHVLAQMPSAFTQYLCALDFLLGPSHEVVIVGRPGAPDTAAMLRAVRAPFIPNKSVLFVPDGELSAHICALAPFTEGMRCAAGSAAAYVCMGNACQAPIADLEALQKILKE